MNTPTAIRSASTPGQRLTRDYSLLLALARARAAKTSATTGGNPRSVAKAYGRVINGN